MNKLLSGCLCILLLDMTACGGDDTSDSAAPGASAETIETTGNGVRLETPAEIPAGSSFDVAWAGPDDDRDYLAVAEAGADEGSYLNYKYTRDGSPVTLMAPDNPGSYEIRYVADENDATLVAAPLTVTEVSATLDAPESVGAGAKVEVAWTGPANERDYIALSEQGSDPGAYVAYTYTREGSPLEITAPETPGAYEVRYVMGQSDRVLTTRPLTVGAVEAALDVPAEVQIDTPIEVTWTGPANERDYIAVVEQGAPEGKYLFYTYTREGSPLEVRAPETPGLYEIRYITGQTKQILARAPVTVRPLGARLQAPADTTAGASLKVRWSGPNNPQDFIAIAREDAPAGQYESRALSRAGNPATLFAPATPGTYEVRYVLAKEDSILATAPLLITSPAQ